jgi:hypothetical protein
MRVGREIVVRFPFLSGNDFKFVPKFFAVASAKVFDATRVQLVRGFWGAAGGKDRTGFL